MQLIHHSPRLNGEVIESNLQGDGPVSWERQPGRRPLGGVTDVSLYGAIWHPLINDTPQIVLTTRQRYWQGWRQTRQAQWHP